jgi:hypothetical protein
MSSLFALQSATAWLLPTGILLLAVSLIARHWLERVPRRVDALFFWLGVSALGAAALFFLLPYAIVFFSARPA